MRLHLLASLALFLVVPTLKAAPQASTERPRLVLQITVDQLRGDQVPRMAHRFGEAGFRAIFDSGIHYQAAHYAHGTTMTAPGHATLFTGASPREHGVIANDWFNPATNSTVYCCEDPDRQVFGQAPNPRQGASPKNLLSSTIGDELVLATGGRSRVFAVSVKDRGAILPAGHSGKAFWYSADQGGFVTSDYYYDAPPAWATEWNGKKLADTYRETSWELSADTATYLFADDRGFERGYRTLGPTFPKPYGDQTGRAFYKLLPYTPAGDELVLSFTKALFDAEAIGQGPDTDFLAVSFSSTDYIGHMWGPNSCEAEDNLLRLDRTIAALLEHVDRHVGLANTLIVLSADHGAPDAPELLTSLGQQVDWVDDLEMLKAANRALKEYFETDEPLIRAHITPYIYLDHPQIRALNLDPNDVANVISKSIESQPGIAQAVPRWRFESGQMEDSPLADRLKAGFHSQRSGDLWLVVQPQWQIGSGNAKAVLTSIHGSPWSYDTHVPIVFAGFGLDGRTVTRPVCPRDIAPTLAALLGVKMPSASVGSVLGEVLR